MERTEDFRFSLCLSQLIDNVLRNLLNAPHSPVDTILYFRQMSIPCYFISFLKAKKTRIYEKEITT